MTAPLDQIIAEMRAGLEGATEGKWEWMIHDHSMASLGVGSDPGMGTPLVLSISPCRSCSTERVKDGEWKWGRCSTPCEANAAHIARCSPDNIAAILNALSEATSARDEALNQLSSRTHDRDSQQRAAITLLDRATKAEAERDEAQLLSLENHNLAASNKARAYKLAVAIMGGEDAPGYADSIDTDVLVKQLRDERSGRDAWTDAAVRVAIAKAEAERDAAVEALKPFAELAGEFADDDQRSKANDRPVWGYNDCDLTYGDFRRARSITAKEPT